MLPSNQLFQIIRILSLREQGSVERFWKGPDTVAFTVGEVSAVPRGSVAVA